MAARRKAAATGSLYKSISTRKKTVRIDRTDIILSAPGRATAEVVRDAQVELLPAGDAEDRDLKKLAEYSLSLTALCLRSCWPEDLSDDEARHLIMITGGSEYGTLAVAARGLCGIRYAKDAEGADEALDRPS